MHATTVAVDLAKSVFQIAIADDNWKVVEQLRPVIRSAHDRITAPLSDREREMLLDLLGRLIKAADVKSSSSS